MQESLETDITCLYCMNIYDDPITLIPCGHSYCRKCSEGYSNGCSECHQKTVLNGEGKSYINAANLKSISGKVTFLKQALTSIS